MVISSNVWSISPIVWKCCKRIFKSANSTSSSSADVKVDGQGRITIPRLDVAVDAGRVIHPERVRAQFEGAAVFGASLALMGEITAAQGKIQQSNFDDYPVARIDEAPLSTHVHLVPSEALPTGVGEPGVPPIAPAICNALFAITGQRIRQLPIRNTKLV
jgi:isoquinoline 1-oxidoreductase beta subunit